MRPDVDKPRICDHVVEPGTWQELHDGVIVQLQPAHPPHARTHGQLSYLLRGAVVPGYGVDNELLTRTSARWDFASDACIRKNGIDPDTGCRYLEELAFEINYSQSEKDLRNKVQEMSARGVRRVFVIDVSSADRGASGKVDGVREWLGAENRWKQLGMDDVIEDPCLEQPLAVRALCDGTLADNAVVRALDAKANPAIAEIRARSFADGIVDGKRAALRAVLAHRGIALSTAQKARLDACEDLAVLDAWLTRALTAERAQELFA